VRLNDSAQKKNTVVISRAAAKNDRIWRRPKTSSLENTIDSGT
jgi:hypothetical protein